MRKNFSVIFIFVLCLAFAACGKQSENSASEIKNSVDYHEFIDKAWGEYCAANDKSWKDCNATDEKAWSEYLRFERAELEKFRMIDRESYLQWLDAEKMYDYKRKEEIETTVLAAKEYATNVGKKYEEYKKIKKAASQKQAAVEAAAKKKYDDKIKAADEAYERIRNN